MPKNTKTVVFLNAVALLERLVEEFPGLIDNETEVNGADLTNALTYNIASDRALTAHLADKAKGTAHNAT